MKSMVLSLFSCRNHHEFIEETQTIDPDPSYLTEPIPDDAEQINGLLQKESMRSNPSKFDVCC